MTSPHMAKFIVPQASGHPGRTVKVQGRPVPTPPPSKKAAAASRQPEPAAELSPEDISAQFTSSNPDHRKELVELRWSELQVDPRYQRGENPAEIKRISENLVVAALGTPVVSARRDPDTGEYTFWVLDGQQRRASVLKAGYEEPHVFDVHFNLTLAEEAQLFLLLNDRKDVNAMSKFQAALVAGDPTAVSIMKVLSDLGIHLNDPPRGFMGVVKARAILKRRNGLEQFKWSMSTIQDVYDQERHGGVYDSRFVDGFAIFYRHHEGKFKQVDLVRKLQHAGNINALYQRALTYREIYGGKIGTAVANAIIRAYNSGRHKNKLDFIGVGMLAEDSGEYDDE